MRGFLGRVVVCSFVMLMCGVLGVRVISLFAATATGPQAKVLNDVGELIAFSPDGKTLLAGYTGYEDHTIGLWDVRTGDLRRTLRGASELAVIALSPDGMTVARVSHDRTSIVLCDLESGMTKHVLPGNDSRVGAVAFSPDGRRVASGSRDHTVRQWDAETGKLQHTLSGHDEIVSCVAFSPDGKLLASGRGAISGNEVPAADVRIWDAQTGEIKRKIPAHNLWVRSVAFSPDGKTLATGGGDEATVKLWDPQTGELKRTLTDGAMKCVRSVTFSTDGKLLAAGGDAQEGLSKNEQTMVTLWNPVTGKTIDSLAGGTIQIMHVLFSPDGRMLAGAGRGIFIWDISRLRR